MLRFTITLAVLFAALPAAAFAQSAPTTSVIAPSDRAVVSYADLDIASAAGKRILNRRLGGAIEQVCGSFANAREYAEEDRVTQCRGAAWASAERQLAEHPASQRLALNVAR